MKLTLNNIPYDTSKEQNFETEAWVGYKVTVQYSKNGYYAHLSEKPVVFNNVSQVHSKYDHGTGGLDRIAFESDYAHKTGRWNYMIDIDWVSVELADKIEDCFSTYNQY